MNEAGQIASPSAAAGHNRLRNPGVALEPAWFESVAVNASAVERRTAFTMAGPKEMFGTNLPSITSIWIQSAPAWSTA